MKIKITTLLIVISLLCSSILYGCTQQSNIPDSGNNKIHASEDSDIESSEFQNTKESEKISELDITFLDVGKADCIIIQDSGSVVMIDTAEEENYSDIDAFLENEGIKEIDYLIITHYDKDHIGGASQLIENYSIKNIIQPNYDKDSKSVEAYESSLEIANIDPMLLKENITFSLPDYELTLLPSETIYKDDNNNSIISTITYEEKHLLFMGDAKEERITEFLEYNTDTYDLIKMPHHGNYNDLTEALIKETAPSQAVITCSNKNPANQETLEILSSYQVKTYQTIDSNITINYNETTDSK